MPSLPSKLRKSPAFRRLCDLVARDRLIVITGAGISVGLRRRYGKGTVPGWLDLLEGIARHWKSKLSRTARKHIHHLLHEHSTGEQLIEAASILREAGPNEFDKEVRRATTPASHQPAAVRQSKAQLQRSLFGLGPRGIVTFNYDDQHERMLQQTGRDWMVVNPLERGSERQLRDLLAENCDKPFLIKAHGSILSRAPLVLHYESYRDLIERNPAYRAFIQHLFTNFSFVIVGFGMSDLDFDLFRHGMARAFGSPLQRHVVLRREPASRDVTREKAEEVLLSSRFGIETLYLQSFDQIPHVLDEAARTPGPYLEELLVRCVSSRHAHRSMAHRALAMIGPSGAAVASRILRSHVENGMRTLGRNPTAGKVRVLSEWVYSLGSVRPQDRAESDSNRRLLLNVALAHRHSELTAHAISVLTSLACPEDVPKLERIGRLLVKRPLPADRAHPDPDRRLLVYVEGLILKLRAAHRRFPSRLALLEPASSQKAR